MRNIKKRAVALILALSLCVCSVGVHTQKSEAVIGWVIGKVVKTVAKKAVKKAIAHKAVGTVKAAYKKKQKKFKVSSATRKVYVKEKVRLKPLLCYGNKIKWSSSNKKVATVSSKGVVKGKRVGTAFIKAVPSISKKISRIKIKVRYRKSWLKFKVKSTPRVIFVNETLKLKPSNCYGNKIKWSSSNKAVATVTSSGVVKGKKEGVATIKAKTSLSKKVSKIKITVKNPFKTIYKKVTLTEGESDYLEIDDIGKVSSSNPFVAKAYYDEDEDALCIDAKSAGTCKVTAVRAYTGQKIIITVVVKKKTPKPTITPEPEPEPEPEPTGTPEPEPAETSEPAE